MTRKHKQIAHYVICDVVFPWLGYAVAVFWVWLEYFDREKQDGFFVFIFPIIMCLVRAGIGSRAMRDGTTMRSSRIRRIIHQVLFAVGLLVLMIFESFITVLSFSRNIPLSVWLWAFMFYSLYLVLIFLSYRVVQAVEIPTEQNYR